MSDLIEKREYHKNRALKSIYYVDENGNRQGLCKEYDSSGNLLVAAEYKDNKLNGERECYKLNCTETYNNGILEKRVSIKSRGTYYEEFENGNLVHKLVEFRNDEQKEIFYKDGKEYMRSIKIPYFIRGDKNTYYKTYTKVNGKYHGLYEDMLKGVKAHYNNGILDGPYEDSYRKGTYNNGKFTGWVHFFSRNSYASRIEKFDYMKRTLLNAPSFNYDESFLKEEWSDGKCVEMRFSKTKSPNSYSNPTKSFHGDIRRNGGCYEEYYKPGYKIRLEYNNKNGKRCGLFIKKINNLLVEKAEYQDGKLHGKRIKYTSDGQVSSVEIFRDGENITDKLERLKRVAKGNVSEEKGVTTPKRSKLSKVTAMLKDRLSGNSGQ